MRLGIFIFMLCMHLGFAKDKIIVAISATPSNLSPFFSTDASSQNINRLVHRSLVDADAKMHFVCNACESFEQRNIGKKEIIKFKLRNDLKFSDGTKVNAIDVKNSWIYFAKNKKINSTYMSIYETIEEIKIENNLNFEIIFNQFSLDNLSNLALLKIVKIKNPEQSLLELNEIIGCGNYTIEKNEPLQIVLAPFDSGNPKLVFKVVKDETTLALKLINKEVDLSVATMSPRKITWLKKQNKIIKSWEIPGANYIFMGINHQREIFKNRNIRKALSLLIPREEILKYKLNNTAVLSHGMFSPAFSDLYENSSNENYNPEEAKRLLAGKKIELDWKVSNNKASIEIAEVIKFYFEKAGIKVNLTIQEWGTFMAGYKGGKFDVVIAQWVGFTGPQMLNFAYHSDNTPPRGGNRTQYKNVEVDKILDLAISETDYRKRISLYKKAQQVISNDYASINLWHPNIIWIGGPCLKNISLDPTGSFESLPKVVKNCE